MKNLFDSPSKSSSDFPQMLLKITDPEVKLNFKQYFEAALWEKKFHDFNQPSKLLGGGVGEGI